LNDLFEFNAANTSFNLVHRESQDGSVPTPRYAFGFAASPHGKAYVFGGKAFSKRDTVSWVTVKGGFDALDSSTRTMALANDDLWELDLHSKIWSELSQSMFVDLRCNSEGFVGDDAYDGSYEMNTGPNYNEGFFGDGACDKGCDNVTDYYVATHGFCENYAGMSDFALVYQPGGSLRFLGGFWGTTWALGGGSRYRKSVSGRGLLAWGEYTPASRTWRLWNESQTLTTCRDIEVSRTHTDTHVARTPKHAHVRTHASPRTHTHTHNHSHASISPISFLHTHKLSLSHTHTYTHTQVWIMPLPSFEPTECDLGRFGHLVHYSCSEHPFQQLCCECGGGVPLSPPLPVRTIVHDGPVDEYNRPFHYGLTDVGDSVSMTVVGDSDGLIHVLAERSATGTDSSDVVPVFERWTQATGWSLATVTTAVSTVALPPPVEFYGATVCGASVYVFGGGTVASERWVDSDGKNMSVQMPRWSERGCDLPYHKLYAWDQGRDWASDSFAKPDTITTRYGHAMASMGHHVFLFGGTHGNLDNTHADAERSCDHCDRTDGVGCGIPVDNRDLVQDRDVQPQSNSHWIELESRQKWWGVKYGAKRKKH